MFGASVVSLGHPKKIALPLTYPPPQPSLLVQVTVPLRMWISEDDIVDHLAIFGDNEAVSAPKFVGEYVTIRVEVSGKLGRGGDGLNYERRKKT